MTRLLMFGRMMRGACVAVCALGLLAAVGCGDSRRYKIGVSQPSIDEWRTQMNEEIEREALFHDDAEVVIRSADDNSAAQADDIRWFIDHGFDVIVASPRDADSVSSVLKEAHDRGIKVIIFDRAVRGSGYSTYIALDNVGIGRESGRYAVTRLPEGRGQIIELRGLDGSTPAAERHEGFKEAVDASPGADLVASVAADWRGPRASAATDSLLRIYPDVKLIYAQNDVMAIAAAKAARGAGRHDIVVVGTDAAPGLGMKAVADSVIAASFIYPTEGERVVRDALALMHGLPLPKVQNIPAHFMVDATNARGLLQQNELLHDKTLQIQQLQQRNAMIRTRQQAQRWILIVAAVALASLAAGVVMLIRNLRQRRRYQADLTAANASLKLQRDRQEELYNELEEATRSKLVFFTNVSHDLRTPLTLIAEPVSQVAASPRLDTKERSLMDIAARNVKILRRLIDQILDFRTYQNGKTEIHLSETDLHRQLAAWTESFAEVAKSRGMEYRVDLSGVPEGECAETDVEKLERIVFNLLSNAFKFTPSRGRVSFTARLSSHLLTITVADTGIGIAPEEQQLVFDRFYRCDKVNPTGSGIGLSLTKAFVELLGGEITLKSQLGQGSEFRVTLPMGACARPAPVAVAHVSNKSGDILSQLEDTAREATDMQPDLPLVLAVDDNRDILDMLSGMTAGVYNLITATDGESALRLAMRYVPDLIICDIMMPGTDGFGVLERLKTEHTTSHIPVLMLTACNLDEQRVQSYDTGADAYISKPFSASLLLSRVSALLANRIRIRDHYAENIPAAADKKGGNSQAMPATNDPLEVENEFYRRFIAIIRRDYADPGLSLQTVGDELAIGPTQLTRKIKALTGMSPVDVIRNVRLRRSREMLLTTGLSVAEIAYSCGFSSPQYFTKCFRDYYGQTPTQLRNI